MSDAIAAVMEAFTWGLGAGVGFVVLVAFARRSQGR